MWVLSLPPTGVTILTQASSTLGLCFLSCEPEVFAHGWCGPLLSERHFLPASTAFPMGSPVTGAVGLCALLEWACSLSPLELVDARMPDDPQPVPSHPVYFLLSHPEDTECRPGRKVQPWRCLA